MQSGTYMTETHLMKEEKEFNSSDTGLCGNTSEISSL